MGKDFFANSYVANYIHEFFCTENIQRTGKEKGFSQLRIFADIYLFPFFSFRAKAQRKGDMV